MPYVSCQYAPPDPTGMQMPETKQGENARITCIDEQGQTWWLSEDSEVGDWLEYKAKGGTIDPAEEPLEPQQPLTPERDYGAEIDALEARVTALEEKS